MLERRLITAFSCGLVCEESGKGSADLEIFIPQVVALLQVMGASARIEAPNIVGARFGHREMSETDAERAVLAALELVTSKRNDPRFNRLNLRIGISSGMIWTATDQTLIGSGGNLSNAIEIQASALRERAAPDEILISGATRDFVKGLFEYAPGEPIVLRNFSEPVRAFVVSRSSPAENRFEALRSQRLRFLGRPHELSLLTRLWTSSSSGCGKAVFITGVQGIGKSRLVSEFEQRLEGVPVARMRFFGSPNHQNSAFYPFGRFLERLCNLGSGASMLEKQTRLRAYLNGLGLGAAHSEVLFESLPHLRISGNTAANASPAAATSSARKHRELILEAFLELVQAQARQGHLLIIFEDLHWADPTSRELVELIVGNSAALPILVLVTSRQEVVPSWLSAEHVSTMTLQPLTPSETAALISVVGKNRDIAEAVSEHIVECTGGIPLFVEELTKVFIDAGLQGKEAGALQTSLTALPIDIHAALLARIDPLREGKTVARIASVVGRRFTHRLLEGVSGLDPEQLNLGLARLIDAGLVFRRGTPPDAEYLFKHSLVKEAVYSSIPSVEKKALHSRAAALLQTEEEGFEPEVIAFHLAQGGDSDLAANFWLLAGRRAISRSANLEAIEHLKAGLRSLRKVPPSPDRERRERHLLMALGPALMAVHGYGSIEASNVFERAAGLIDEATPVPERLHIICGLWNVRSGRSELYTALGLAQQFFDLAQAAGAGLNLGNCMMGQTLAPMGDFKRAQSHFLNVVEQFRNQNTDPHGVHFTADEHILALTYLARVLWALGYPGKAAAAGKEALERARNGADAVSVAIALVGQMFMAAHGGDLGETAATIDEAVAHCTRHGLYLFEHWMEFNRGALLVRQGDAIRGIELMRSAAAAAHARQSRQFRVFQLSCIGEAYLKLKDHKQALAILDEAIELAEKTGERWSEAGVQRLRAETLIELGQTAEGFQALGLALALARRQGARLEELRIATTMARLANGGEQARSAYEALRAVYDQFEDGHSLPDLAAAREQMSMLRSLRT